MKLLEKEAEILACIELRAELSIDRIRKETGYRDHTIRYCISKLEARKIIVKVPIVNIFVMGYTMHNIFFSLGSESKNLKSKLSDAIMAMPEVLWFAETGGDFQYALGVCTYRIQEVRELLHKLSDRFGNVFFEKNVATQFSAVVHPRKYLSKKTFGNSPIATYQPGPLVTLDNTDRKILTALSTGGSSSHRQLAQLLGIPLSTFELRIKKLEDSKVIAGYIYAINVAALGMQSYKLLIYGKGINSKLGQSLLRFAETHRSVTAVVESFGSWDYELNIEVQEAQEVVGVTQEIYESVGPMIQTIKVLSKFRDVKFLTHPG